jgi:hypothetical protein
MYLLIDPPVDPFSPSDEIVAWIAELEEPAQRPEYRKRWPGRNPDLYRWVNPARLHAGPGERARRFGAPLQERPWLDPEHRRKPADGVDSRGGARGFDLGDARL